MLAIEPFRRQFARCFAMRRKDLTERPTCQFYLRVVLQQLLENAALGF